jgi:hypothetical protein
MFEVFPNWDYAGVDPQQHETTHIADPLADLLLSVAAIIVLLVIAIFPTLSHRAASKAFLASPGDSSRQMPRFLLQGREIEPFVATEQGLLVGRSARRTIPVDSVFVDGDLVAMLERMRDADEALVLLIESNGLEAAFQFEVVANRHGPREMRQIRLDPGCRFPQADLTEVECHNLAGHSGN